MLRRTVSVYDGITNTHVRQSRASGGLTQRERAVLDALSARLVPTDEHGPGAREANVVRYVERALGTAYREHLPAYAEGLRAIDEYADASDGAGFCELAPERQDALLTDIERGRAPGFRLGSNVFFELVRQHVLEGMFGDPSWGGNAGFAGWDLLDYPGVRPVWTEAEQQLDAVVARAHQGIAELRGTGPIRERT